MKIKRKRLTDFAVSIFVSMGTSEKHATEVATHLVEANLKGHDSHGVGLIPYYVNSWDKGGLKVNADATLEKGSNQEIPKMFTCGASIMS